MLRLWVLEMRKVYHLRSARVGLLLAFLLPFLWAWAPGVEEVYGLVVVSGFQVPALGLLAGMEFLFPFLAVMVASEALGAEVALGTLRTLFLRPLPRGLLLLSKFLALLPYPLALMAANLLGGLLAGAPQGFSGFYGGLGLGPSGLAGEGYLSPGAAWSGLLRAHLLAALVLIPPMALALFYGAWFLSTAAAALATMATLLAMRLLVVFPALAPWLLTQYLDLYLRGDPLPGLPFLGLYTLGFFLLALFLFARKDL